MNQAPVPPLSMPQDRVKLSKRHEESDVNPMGIGIFGVGLAVAMALIFGVLFLLFRFFGLSDSQRDSLRRRQEPAAASLVHPASDYRGPLLQAAAEEELKALHVASDEALDRYGWIDMPSGTVRIPIARAIELTAQRGLPPTSPGIRLEDMQRQRAAPQPARQNLPP